MLEAEHFSGATESGLHFVGNEQRAVFPAEVLRAHKEICLRCLAPFALNSLDDKSCDIAGMQLSIQFLDIIEQHTRIEPFHQWTEPFGKTFAAHQ